MTAAPRARCWRALAVGVVGLWLAGCAGPFGLLGSEKSIPPFRDPGLSMASAAAAITPGVTRKADVSAILGPATSIQFDSGFEVWVYREKSQKPAAAKSELVILFAPTGIVKKTRTRLPTTPSQG